ncbi:hypothetical protein OHA18_10075 [Kribbella sp. NBC_00709]|uniref:hypothetical protein n=1 Tax=Kribbella sp. NBC_00709 TaxID=2975972 RepID=UPI002E2AEBD4|nr:hypothetical protein [Kribbella sp. NBC_00709]
MNLQDLRDELATQAASADQHPSDLLPGVKDKIRGTRRRRTFTAVGVVAVIAAIAAGLVPGLRSTPPAPANPPEDFTRDGLTVPGLVGNDRLLKAWIGDRGQGKLAFSWTPTTDSITIHANCSGDGGALGVRFKINGWYVGDAGCGAQPEAWSMDGGALLRPDSPFWLSSPVGKPAEVSAELIDLETRRPAGTNARIWFGIYSTGANAAANGVPTRTVPADPDAYTNYGVVYRSKIGGDILAGAKVADPGRTEVRFSFTATGNRLILHDFCTANAGSDTALPYSVSMRIGPGEPFLSTCQASSTDAGVGSSITIASPVPAGQRVDVVAQIVPSQKNGPAAPPDARLGMGVYFEGDQQVVDGVSLPEQTEMAGYVYKLADLKTAPGPAGHVSIDTPADKPYVIAYGGSTLGSGQFEAGLSVGKTETGRNVASADGLGVGWDAQGAGPADKATMTISGDKPTKGTLILAIYLPV